jgi:hypothetical protein
MEASCCAVCPFVFPLTKRDKKNILYVKGVNLSHSATKLYAPGHMIVRPYQDGVFLPDAPSMFFLLEMNGLQGDIQLFSLRFKSAYVSTVVREVDERIFSTCAEAIEDAGLLVL